MTSKWDVLTSSNNSMAAFVTGIFPSSDQFTSSEPHIDILDMVTDLCWDCIVLDYVAVCV